MVRIDWKLREYLRSHEISVSELARAMGGKRIATLYRLTSRTDPPARVDLPTLAAVIGSLRELTGAEVSVADILEASAEPERPSDDLWAWREAELHPPLEPDAHAELNLAVLGEPLLFDTDEGWTSGDTG